MQVCYNLLVVSFFSVFEHSNEQMISAILPLRIVFMNEADFLNIRKLTHCNVRSFETLSNLVKLCLIVMKFIDVQENTRSRHEVFQVSFKSEVVETALQNYDRKSDALQ